MLEKKYAIGVDIGGTNVRAGLVDVRGKIVCRAMCAVNDGRTPRAMVMMVAQLVRELRAACPARRAKIVGVGCGIPGIVDDRGVVGRSPHFPAWKNTPLGTMIARAVHLPVVADNDANMSAVGELTWGAARGMKSFVMVTLGTGIGGGIVIDGKVHRGAHGYAGEIGHITIDREGFACGCGNHGCWEEYAATSFFKRQGFGGKELEARARAGDAAARALWQEYGRNLGVGIASLINVLGITNFVIGGGVSRAARLFLPATRAEIKRRSYPQNFKRLVLKTSTLVDEAGVLGAAAAAFKSS